MSKEQLIEIDFEDESYSCMFDTSKNLKEFRESEKIRDEYYFTTQRNSIVKKDDEFKIEINLILKDNIIKLKKKENKQNEEKKEKEIKENKEKKEKIEPVKSTTVELIENERKLKIKESIDQKSNQTDIGNSSELTIKSSNGSSCASVDFSKKELIISTLSNFYNFKSTINSIGEFIEEDSINYKNEDIQLKKPTKTLFSNKSFTFNKNEHQLSKSLTIEGSFKLDSLSISAETKCKFSKESLDVEVGKEVYLISSVSVPRLEFCINPLKVKLSDEFYSKLNNVETHNELNKVFKEYGEFYPKRYILGGMITNHETQKFTTIENLESKLLSLSAGVNAAIGPVKVGGSVGGESATDEKTSKQNEENSSKKDVIGGDPSKTGSEWVSSLSDINNWSIIGIDVYPIMDLIKKNDNTLYNKLEKIKNSITLICNVKKWKSIDFWKSEDFEFQGKKFNITISKLNDSVIYPRINYLEDGNMVIKYCGHFYEENQRFYQIQNFTKDSDNGYCTDKICGGGVGTTPDSFTYSFHIIKPDENDIGSLVIK
ncbi:hypothetical protein ACTFIR_001857 [Dictyostelium discoideum]